MTGGGTKEERFSDRKLTQEFAIGKAARGEGKGGSGKKGASNHQCGHGSGNEESKVLLMQW
jgi:hypothetical protein